MHLVLFQKSPKLFSFLLILFFFCSTPVMSSSLTHSSVSLRHLLIHSDIFCISIYVFFISVWLCFRFSNSLFKTSYFLLCISILLPSFLTIFTVTTFNSFSDRLPSSTSLSSSFGILSCSLFGMYSSISSFFLNCCLFVFLCIW